MTQLDIFARICAGLDYLLAEFPSMTSHSQLQWIEAFEVSDVLEDSEGLAGSSLLPASYIRQRAADIQEQHPRETWEYLINRAKLRS